MIVGVGFAGAASGGVAGAGGVGVGVVTHAGVGVFERLGVLRWRGVLGVGVWCKRDWARLGQAWFALSMRGIRNRHRWGSSDV